MTDGCLHGRLRGSRREKQARVARHSTQAGARTMGWLVLGWQRGGGGGGCLGASWGAACPLPGCYPRPGELSTTSIHYRGGRSAVCRCRDAVRTCLQVPGGTLGECVCRELLMPGLLIRRCALGVCMQSCNCLHWKSRQAWGNATTARRCY